MSLEGWTRLSASPSTPTDSSVQLNVSSEGTIEFARIVSSLFGSLPAIRRKGRFTTCIDSRWALKSLRERKLSLQNGHWYAGTYGVAWKDGWVAARNRSRSPSNIQPTVIGYPAYRHRPPPNFYAWPRRRGSKKQVLDGNRKHGLVRWVLNKFRRWSEIA
jgi:hypothetical protein